MFYAHMSLSASLVILNQHSFMQLSNKPVYLTALLLSFLGLSNRVSAMEEAPHARMRFVKRFLEEDKLACLLQSQHHDLIREWKAFCNANHSIEELYHKAESLISEHYNRETHPSTFSVLGNGALMASFSPWLAQSELVALSQASKFVKVNCDCGFHRKYMSDGKMNWNLLLGDIRACAPADRRPLVRFLKKNWPRSDDQMTSTLLTQALSNFKKCVQAGRTYAAYLPYIPGHFELWKALIDVKAATDFRLSFDYLPIEAFFHENFMEIKTLLGNGKLPFADVKAILESGDKKAIANLTIAFPPIEFTDDGFLMPLNNQILAENIRPLISIYCHKDTNRAGLMQYLRDLVESKEAEGDFDELVSLLMESPLETADILALIEGKIGDEKFFYYPARLLEIISISGIFRIDIEKLRSEKFKGSYSAMLCSQMSKLHFLTIAVLAGADYEIVASVLMKYPAHSQEICMRLVYPAIVAGRSTELVAQLLQNSTASECLLPKGFLIPDKYLKCFFKDNKFSKRHLQELFVGHCPASQAYIDATLDALTPAQLMDFLGNSIFVSRSSVDVSIFIKLLDLLLTSPDKKAVAMQFISYNSQKAALETALIHQSFVVLQSIKSSTQMKPIHDAVDAAIKIKKEFMSSE